MDHSPIRQTFEFGKSISTAGKSILNFIQLSSLVAKYCKMWKIWPRKVCEFCIILMYYARKSVTTMWKCGNAFSRERIQNSQTLHYYIFDILQYLTTKLHNFTKFRKLFLIVLKLFPNLKVCLIGEWSIKAQRVRHDAKS